MGRVRVNEDDALQRESLRLLLASRDVETVEARTGAECLEQLASGTFDCMVLDLNLPDASGFEVLERLSMDEVASFPPVIVYTGQDLSPDDEIGRAHVWTPVTNAQLVCRLLLEKTHKT